MNRIKHYHNQLCDTHVMERQAEFMLESIAGRIDNYPELCVRVEQYLSRTKNQTVQLETIPDRNGISRSAIKDSMSETAALGQLVGGIFPSDEIVRDSTSRYIFEQFEIAYYTSLLAAAKSTGDITSIPTIEAILNEEEQMANQLTQRIPQTTEKFLIRSETSGIEAGK